MSGEAERASAESTTPSGRLPVGAAPSARDDVARRSVLLGTAGTALLNVTTVAVGFVLALVLARTLGPAGYGAYAFAFAWATFLSVPAALGIVPLVVRHVASYGVRKEWGLLRGVVRRSNYVVACSSTVIVAAAAVTGSLLRGSRPDLLEPFLVGLLLVPIIALTSLRQAAMQGLNHVVLGRIPDTVVLPLGFLALSGVAAWLLGDRFTATWAIALNVVAAGGAFLLGATLLRRALPPKVREAKPEYEVRSWVRSGAPLLLLGVLLVLNAQVGTIVLGILGEAEDAGVFNVASRAAGFTSFFFLAASYPLYPQVARLWATGDIEAIQRLMTRASRVVLAISAALALAFLVFGETLLRVFGSDFLSGTTALRILVVAELVKVVAGFGGIALVMTPHEGSMTRGMLAGVVANVALTAALAPSLEIEGAAVAALAGALIASVSISWLTWRRLGIYAPAVGRPMSRS